MIRTTRVALATALMVAASGPGLATDNPDASHSNASPAPDLRIEDCEARLPDSEGQATAGSAPRQEETLAEVLNECDSIIRAPEIGDSELTTPPPSTGSEMPVLRPGEIPQQGGRN